MYSLCVIKAQRPFRGRGQKPRRVRLQIIRGFTMRAFAFAALTVGVLAITPVAASADTIMETFTIEVSGSANQTFTSSTFAGFDPSLGALMGATVSLMGSTIWTSSSSPATLSMELSLPIPSSEFFPFGGEPGDPQTVEIDMTGTVPPGGIGPDRHEEELSVSDSPGDGTLGSAVLRGTVTYTFTRAGSTVPEPSTWAMMLVGLAGLGYAALRRRGALRAI
jgi:PEP-CTERM motif